MTRPISSIPCGPITFVQGALFLLTLLRSKKFAAYVLGREDPPFTDGAHPESDGSLTLAGVPLKAKLSGQLSGLLSGCHGMEADSAGQQLRLFLLNI